MSIRDIAGLPKSWQETPYLLGLFPGMLVALADWLEVEHGLFVFSAQVMGIPYYGHYNTC